MRKKSREMKKARNAIFENPFRFVCKMLGKAKSGNLEYPIKDVEEWITGNHGEMKNWDCVKSMSQQKTPTRCSVYVGS